MAKTFNLNPGADATLVASATRAALANVPTDLSGTFEAMATNYANTMQTIGEAWGQVAQIGGKFMGEATKNFIRHEKYRALGSTFQNEQGNKFLLEGEYGLNNIKSQLWDTWKKNPFSMENRAKRIKLKEKRDKLYAQIDELGTGYSNVATTLAAKNYSEGAMNSNVLDARLLSAAGALSSSSGKSENGDYVKPSHDEYGDLVLTLFDANDNVVTRAGGENVSVKSGDLNKMIVTKVPKSKNDFYKFTDDMRALGAKKGTKWENSKIRYLANVETTVADENSLHYMMHENRLYQQEESLADDLNNPGGSVTSANIFGLMGNQIPADLMGEIDEMADNKKGYSATDFTTGAKGAENYSKIVSALTNRKNKFYNENTTRELFLKWAEQQGESAFTYGTGFRRFSKDNEGGVKNKFGLSLDKTYYTMYDEDRQASYVTGQDIENSVETFKRVQDKGSGIFTGYDYIPHKLKDGKWFTYDDKTDDFTTPSDANSIFTSLRWNNNPKIMEYLKPKQLVDHDNMSPTPLQFLNTDWSKKNQ